MDTTRSEISLRIAESGDAAKRIGTGRDRPGANVVTFVTSASSATLGLEEQPRRCDIAVVRTTAM